MYPLPSNSTPTSPLVTYRTFALSIPFQPPMSMASLMPGWFDEHQARMKRYGRVHSAGILFPADRRGHVDGGKLKFRIDENEDLPVLRRAMATWTKVHIPGGAVDNSPELAIGKAAGREKEGW